MKRIGSRGPTSMWRIFVCLLTICFAPAVQATSPPSAALRQGISSIAQFGQDLGRLPGSTPIEIVTILNLQSEDELRTLIAAQTDPGSPSYHQFLTAEEFVQRFS